MNFRILDNDKKYDFASLIESKFDIKQKQSSRPLKAVSGTFKIHGVPVYIHLWYDGGVVDVKYRLTARWTALFAEVK